MLYISKANCPKIWTQIRMHFDNYTLSDYEQNYTVDDIRPHSLKATVIINLMLMNNEGSDPVQFVQFWFVCQFRI